MKSPQRDDPQKILLVKLSAVGDVVQTFPVLEALRNRFPQAEIDWLVEEEASGLLRGHPALHRVIVSRRKSWAREVLQKHRFRKTWQEIRQFTRELRSREYDWIIDTHGIFKSGLLVFLSRGRRKIGFRHVRGIADEGSYLFTNERYPPLPIERHALERYLDLIAKLGVPVDPPRLDFSVPEDAQRNVEELLQKGGGSGHPRVVIHPMAKWPSKQWPSRNFSQLADDLARSGAQVVFSGSADDEKGIGKILAGVKNSRSILNLAGQTKLTELAALFARSDLVITTDTGPMHLAAAVKAPLIALFGPTAPWRTGPYGNGHIVLRHALDCGPCFRKECSTLNCMKEISVGEVYAPATTKLMEKGYTARPASPER